MQYEINTTLEDFSTPGALFTQTHELNPTDIAGAETTLTETPQENGIKLPLPTQPYPTNSPPVDARKPFPPLLHLPVCTQAPPTA